MLEASMTPDLHGRRHAKGFDYKTFDTQTFDYKTCGTQTFDYKTFDCKTLNGRLPPQNNSDVDEKACVFIVLT